MGRLLVLLPCLGKALLGRRDSDVKNGPRLSGERAQCAAALRLSARSRGDPPDVCVVCRVCGVCGRVCTVHMGCKAREED